jgi:hypothetical protein
MARRFHNESSFEDPLLKLYSEDPNLGGFSLGFDEECPSQVPKPSMILRMNDFLLK